MFKQYRTDRENNKKQRPDIFLPTRTHVLICVKNREGKSHFGLVLAYKRFFFFEHTHGMTHVCFRR